jgi:hypothetical protein
MKTKWTFLFLLSIFWMSPSLMNAQENSSNERVFAENFTGIIVGGYFKINLIKGEPKIVFDAKEDDIAKINTEIRNGVLEITSRPLRKKSPVQLNIYSNYIEDYDISGAVIISSEEVQKPENISISLSGAAKINLEVETGDIKANLSGASMLELKGTANAISCKASGASILKTPALKTIQSDIVVTGAAGVLVDDKNSEVSSFERRIGKVEEAEDAEGAEEAEEIDEEKTTYGVIYDGSVARAKFLGIQVHVDEDDETGEVRIGTHKWIYDSEGEVSHKRVKYTKFNGHWGGVGIGINGFVNEKYVYDLPKEYEFMDLLWQKSVNVDLNIYEQNINLSSNNNIGLVTGIGFSIHNYRFNKSFTVMQDSNYFTATYNQGVNVRKSKIVTNYITVPVLFEIQDKNPNPLTKYRWHVNIGAIFGVRVHAHQKTYFNETNKSYNLVDPLSGDVVATATSPSYNIAKVHDNFYMRPFKVDASLRIGWGWINLYGNVSLTEMFNSGKGPKLYPFSVGIMLTSW